jgi:hypothetical protein
MQSIWIYPGPPMAGPAALFYKKKGPLRHIDPKFWNVFIFE